MKCNLNQKCTLYHGQVHESLQAIIPGDKLESMNTCILCQRLKKHHHVFCSRTNIGLQYLKDVTILGACLRRKLFQSVEPTHSPPICVVQNQFGHFSHLNWTQFENSLLSSFKYQFCSWEFARMKIWSCSRSERGVASNPQIAQSTPIAHKSRFSALSGAPCSIFACPCQDQLVTSHDITKTTRMVKSKPEIHQVILSFERTGDVLRQEMGFSRDGKCRKQLFWLRWCHCT